MRHDTGEGGVGEHECRRVLRYYDSDNDGRLNLNEYVDLCLISLVVSNKCSCRAKITL